MTRYPHHSWLLADCQKLQGVDLYISATPADVTAFYTTESPKYCVDQQTHSGISKLSDSQHDWSWLCAAGLVAGEILLNLDFAETWQSEACTLGSLERTLRQ